MSANIINTVPFFSVSDMDASLRFYVDGLGFEMTHKWIPNQKIEWCALKRGGANLMLQQFAKESEHAVLTGEKAGKGVSIVFICKDALALYHEFTGKGIAAEEPIVGNNMWVTGITDPDGYRVLFESDTDVPEETNYSEWIAGNETNKI